MTDGEKVVLVIAVVLIIAALSFISMIPLGLMGGYRGWHMGPGMMGHGWGPSILLWLVLIGVIAYGAYLFLSGSKVKESAAPPQGRAIEVLNERYAKGEITREDYLRMKEELQK